MQVCSDVCMHACTHACMCACMPIPTYTRTGRGGTSRSSCRVCSSPAGFSKVRRGFVEGQMLQRGWQQRCDVMLVNVPHRNSRLHKWHISGGAPLQSRIRKARRCGLYRMRFSTFSSGTRGQALAHGRTNRNCDARTRAS